MLRIVSVGLDVDIKFRMELTDDEVKTINKFYDTLFEEMITQYSGCGNITIKED